MTTACTIVMSICMTITGFSQETVGGKVLQNAKDRTYQRGEQKGDQTVDGALNKVEDGIKGIFKKKEKKQKAEQQDGNANQKQSDGKTGGKSVKKNSKFDFEPGQKQIGFDNFATTNVGDFPLGWNTNSSAEIVTLNNDSQKWLSMTTDGYFQPEFIKDMPANFTLEFEIFTRYASSNILAYQFYLMPSKNPKKDLSEHYPDNYIKFKWTPCSESAGFSIVENSQEVNSNDGLKVPDLACRGDEGKVTKFSIWRQNERIRIYADENKVLDLPQAFDKTQNYNVFKIGARYMNFSNGREHDDEFMIANIRYAVAGEDTRSKLITEGRFVTNGILFDVNSDNIKPESGSVLKEIAATLTENPSVRVKIIGHTDSDGDVNANLALSQKRAVAVKNALASFYGIATSRLETDGKGESQSLNKNANTTEKAINRRVEFVKL